MFDMRMRRITPVFVDDCVRDTAPILVATGKQKCFLRSVHNHKVSAIMTFTCFNDLLLTKTIIASFWISSRIA